MSFTIKAVNDQTVHTDSNGRKYTVTEHHILNGVKVGESIKPILLTQAEEDADKRLRMIQKGKVFECGRGVGISAQGYLYLFTDGTVNNGCINDNWKFASVKDAEQFFAKWKGIQSMLLELE